VPNAPAFIQPPTTSDGQFTLSWLPVTVPDGTIDYYELQVSTTTSFITILNQWQPTGTSQGMDESEAGTYYFRVRAHSSRGVFSTWSAPISVIVQPTAGQPFPAAMVLLTGAAAVMSILAVVLVAVRIYRKRRQEAIEIILD
jgi:hypothetical protein